VFQIKRGGIFQWGADRWVIDWSTMIGSSARTWQVDRAVFDNLLLDHARANGVQVSSGTTAKTVSFTDGRPVAVTCAAPGGDPVTIDDFDFLIDASGRTGLLSAQHFRSRRTHRFFRNVAIWGYWRDGRIFADSPQGGINVISAPEGWWWVIPLADGRTSVGLVTHKAAFAQRRGAYPSLDALYHALIEDCAEVNGLVSGAEYQGPARVETDYSYTADRFSGPGHMMVGDSACFLDPLLSTGVHLALYSGLIGAACLTSLNRGEVTEQEALLFFEFAYHRAYTRLLALVSSMYERYEGKDDFFWTAQRLNLDSDQAGIDQPDAASFGEIISGLSDLREASDASTRVLTEQLLAEAHRVEEAFLTAGDGDPDFTPLYDSPFDGDQTGFRLVTEPQLGLRRLITERP
jgi:flavin-dependent dehydrogenase